MIKLNNINLPLDYTEQIIKQKISKKLNISASKIISWHFLKKSVDARKKNAICFNVSLSVLLSQKKEKEILRKNIPSVSLYEEYKYNFFKITEVKKRPVVVGFGPAGMFAALVLAKSGLKPIILEQGTCVEQRQKDILHFIKTGELNERSNVQFGEGGAGTFSDGKLTTGIKNQRIQFILKTFVECGAPSEILYLAKPHIGTDILVDVVKNIRMEIIKYGGEIIFNAKFCDFNTKNNKMTSIIYEKNDKLKTIETDSCILATGHSCRDIFNLLYNRNIELQQKNFAVGVRIEHLQSKINESMYGKFANHPNLGAADYKIAVHMPTGFDLYTFCMCPGGEVVAASSEKKRLVVNGMSFHKRDGNNANSALLVGVSSKMLESNHPLAGMWFQQNIEEKAYIAGGSNYSAPACTLGSFLYGQKNDFNKSIKSTYKLGIKYALPHEYLPNYIVDTLKYGIPMIAEKISGFGDESAVITGVESRSSSPIRILRNENCESVSVNGLYPCGEGAGYAGGIMSAAVDGMKCAESLITKICNK